MSTVSCRAACYLRSQLTIARARPRSMRGFERHQLGPRRFQNATSSPSGDALPFQQACDARTQPRADRVIGVRRGGGQLRGLSDHAERHRGELGLPVLLD